MSQSKTAAEKVAKPAKAQLSDAEARVLRLILQQEPHYEDIKLSVLQIDYSYQDRPRETLVRQIAEQFSPAMLGIFIVSRRPDGTLWTCDGATRKLGLELRGETDRVVRCQVIKTESHKQEALLFKFFNAARKAVPLANRLQAEGIAGVDHGFLKAVKDTGFGLVGNSKRTLKGVGFVKKAFEIDPVAMEKVLYALDNSWNGKHGRLDGVVVLGLTMMYSTVRNCDAQVRRWLKSNEPADVQERMLRAYGGGQKRKETRDAKLRPNGMPWYIAKGIGMAINSRAKEKKLDLQRLDARRDQWETIQAHPA